MTVCSFVMYLQPRTIFVMDLFPRYMTHNYYIKIYLCLSDFLASGFLWDVIMSVWHSKRQAIQLNIRPVLNWCSRTWKVEAGHLAIADTVVWVFSPQQAATLDSLYFLTTQRTLGSSECQYPSWCSAVREMMIGVWKMLWKGAKAVWVHIAWKSTVKIISGFCMNKKRSLFIYQCLS